jgi:hypothetical protein
MSLSFRPAISLSFRAEGEESHPLATPRSLPRLEAGVGMTAPPASENHPRCHSEPPLHCHSEPPPPCHSEPPPPCHSEPKARNLIASQRRDPSPGSEAGVGMTAPSASENHPRCHSEPSLHRHPEPPPRCHSEPKARNLHCRAAPTSLPLAGARHAVQTCSGSSGLQSHRHPAQRTVAGRRRRENLTIAVPTRGTTRHEPAALRVFRIVCARADPDARLLNFGQIGRGR